MKFQRCVAALFMLVFCALSIAKEAPLTEEESTVVQVYEVPGHTKDQIFVTAKMWIAENFKSAKAVIEYESKEDGTIIGNGSIPFPCSGAFDCLAKPDWRVTFTMKLESKDGRFRLTFTNVHLSWPASTDGGMPSPAYEGAIKQRKHMDAIRPKLLEIGKSLVADVGKAKDADKW